MRTNLPVTQKEVLLDEGQIIVSKTDLKGQITYVNQTFIEISGFTEQELIGQPHNIVRHPDMPAAAFADLWNNLKQGRPWSGYVKNRCKNGDHYWVLANASPIFEGGRVVGYMSVRSRVDPATVSQVETLYAGMRSGDRGLVIEEGEAVPAGAWRAFKRRITISQRLIATLLLLFAFLLAFGLYALRSLQNLDDGIRDLYEGHVAEVVELKKVADLYAVNIVDTAHKARNGNLSHDEALALVRAADQGVRAAWQNYREKSHSPERRALVDQADATIRQAEELVRELEDVLVRRDAQALAALTVSKLYPAIDPVSERLATLIDRILAGARDKFVEADQTYVAVMRLMVGLLVLAAVLAWVSGAALLRAVRGPIDQALGYFRQFAEGRLDARITIAQRDEVAGILDAAKAMQVKLGFEVAETRRVADEMTRIKIALDNVSTGVMIADAQRKIIYSNTAAVAVLKGVEATLRQRVPDFAAERLIGRNIDLFHQDPAHQAGLLATLDKPHRARLQIGERHMTVTASPVNSEQGQRLGTVAEWQDRTAEVLTEREIGAIVAAAAAGDLSRRLDLTGKEGFFAVLADGLNGLLANTQGALEATSAALGRVADGDLTETLQEDFDGIFGQLRDDTNRTIERLREVVGQIKDATESINTAAQEIAAGNTDLSSRTEEQASSLEETSSSMEELNATVRQNADNARQANELASRSNEVAIRGGRMVKEVVQTMNGIQESSRRIADIIGVINGIAFQTNILALNAAVEAARAGEQGRGFAVVASEVRSLAQRSASAAKEIKELIDDSVGKVEGGARLVSQAGATMDEVVASFQRVAELVTEISSASREQSSGIEQVTQAVAQMDEVTQQNAALVEQASAAAESLEEQAHGLVTAVSRFRLDDGAPMGARLAAPAIRPPAAINAPLLENREIRSLPAAPRAALPATLKRGEDEWEEF